MAKVVAVHGMNNTYSGRDILADAWRAALLSGLDLAGGRGELAREDIDVVFYGDVFRPPGRHLGAEAPAYDAEDVDGDIEAELLLTWWTAAAESDPAVVPRDERVLGVRDLIQGALNALLCSKFASRVSESNVVFWPKQVKAYLTDPQVHAQIRERFAIAIQPDTRVVVAHSLGSLIAYQALCSVDNRLDCEVGTLITLGSPLGIPLILKRVAPYRTWPHGVHTWTNITDAVDFVASVKQLRPIFGEPLRDISITNGLRAHDATRYLTAVQTGNAVLEGLK